jgi:hypothetical protein
MAAQKDRERASVGSAVNFIQGVAGADDFPETEASAKEKTMSSKHSVLTVESMKPAGIHLAHRGTARANTKDTERGLSNTPLSDPAEILRRMAAQAISPALLELLDLMSSPILLITQSPAGELREMAPAKLVLAAA